MNTKEFEPFKKRLAKEWDSGHYSKISTMLLDEFGDTFLQDMKGQQCIQSDDLIERLIEQLRGEVSSLRLGNSDTDDIMDTATTLQLVNSRPYDIYDVRGSYNLPVALGKEDLLQMTDYLIACSIVDTHVWD